MLPQLLLTGVAQGAIYALVALSMTLIYRATTVVNFGQGDLMMLAAFIVYIGVVLLHADFALAAVVTLIAMVAVGIGIERGLIRPMRGAPHLALTMMTIAIGTVLRGVARYVWGREVLPMPAVFDFDPLILGDLVITADNIAILGAVFLTFAIFMVLFYATGFGRVIQATYQSERGAALIGANVPMIRGIMWGMGALMAGIAGVLVAPVTLLYPDLGANILIRAFAAMTLGGFGSLPGAVLGGFALGIMEQVLGAYVSTSLIDITAYLLIIAVLVLRPAGLLGRRATVRV